MQRYFVRKINDNFILNDNDYHHVKNVMRMKSGDNLICCYNQKSYLCSIEFLNETYKIIVLNELHNDNELSIEVILYQSLIKNDKFDLIVQKATELGVSKIVPLITKRCVVKIEDSQKSKKIERYEKIIKEACEQSTRNHLPCFGPYMDIKNIELEDDCLGLIAYEKNNDIFSLSTELKKIKKYKKVAIVIGPEGGFDLQEISILKEKGFKNVSFGKRILRAETAACFALSIISHYIEGMNNE